MTSNDVIRNTMNQAHFILQSYVADLTDADLLVRPVPGANHIAWQLGHVIASEHDMAAACGYDMPALPDGFAKAHGKETAGSDDAAVFKTKAEYLELFEKQRAAALAALDATPDARLDEPAPEPMRAYAPTIGAMFNMLGIHELMHAAQFVVVRRKLGKPPLF